MRHGPFILRATALLSAGMLAVHDLRYRLDGGGGEHALEHAHGYLSAVGPLVAMVLLIAAGHLLNLVARGGGGTASRPESLAKLWALAAGALVLAFGAQEVIEGAFAQGHPAGLPAIFGAGGWIAVPLAMLAGGAIAVLLRGAEQVLRASGRATIAATRPRALTLAASRDVACDVVARASPLARHGAGRAPPFVCV